MNDEDEASEQLSLPSQVPVMPIPGALLFPNALLPLYIFEPRYRAMLQHSLLNQRMFCVALVDPKRPNWTGTGDFAHVASVGLIRACVERSDGTSNLILQGLARVHFDGFVQESPFPIAEISLLESTGTTSVETEALSTKVLELYERFKGPGKQLPEKIDRYLADLRDPEMLADLMAATFISDPARRQRVLEELSINKRLRLVIQYLREENSAAA